MKYQLSSDAQTGLVRLRLFGIWTLDDVQALRLDMQRVCAALDARGFDRDRIAILSDSREHGVQPQSLTDELSLLAADFARMAGRNAVLVRSVLHKMQVDRLAPEPTIRAFLNEAEALVWLNERG